MVLETHRDDSKASNCFVVEDADVVGHVGNGNDA